MARAGKTCGKEVRSSCVAPLSLARGNIVIKVILIKYMLSRILLLLFRTLLQHISISERFLKDHETLKTSVMMMEIQL